MLRKTVKKVKIHIFFVCTYKSEDCAQIQKKIARLHDCVTVTFRNSESAQQQVNIYLKILNN